MPRRTPATIARATSAPPVTSRRAASTSSWADRLAHHRGHAGLAQRRDPAPAQTGLHREYRAELGADRVGDPVARLGAERPRLEVAAPATRLVAGTDGEEEIGRVRVGGGGERRVVAARGVERGDRARPAEAAPYTVAERSEPGGHRDENPAPVESVRPAPQLLALADTRHRTLGRSAPSWLTDAA